MLAFWKRVALEDDGSGEEFDFAALRTSVWSKRHTVAPIFGLLACILVMLLLSVVSDFAPISPLQQPPAFTPERATVASPRTVPQSINNEEKLSRWHNLHDTLAAEAAAAKPLPDGRPRLVFVGDSITESWRGTEYGRPVPRTDGVPEVLRERFGAYQPEPLILAIAGDQTQHVLWRLSHGELSAALAGDAGTFFVLLIGTNNLGYGQPPDEALAGITAVARHLLTHSAGQLLVIDVLPRQERFTHAILQVNLGLQQNVALLSEEYPGRVRRVDCGAPFLGNGTEVRLDLMPDQLHPNAQGQRLLARCIEPLLPPARPLTPGWGPGAEPERPHTPIV